MDRNNNIFGFNATIMTNHGEFSKVIVEIDLTKIGKKGQMEMYYGGGGAMRDEFSVFILQEFPSTSWD